VTFSGSGFSPGEQVIVTVGTGVSAGGSAAGSVSRAVGFRVPLAALQITTQADTDGKFSVEVPLPEAGIYTLTAKGATSGVIQTNTVTVKAAEPAAAGVAAKASTTTGGLPETGADGLFTWGFIGGGALVAGGVSIALVRRNAKPATV
jgi:LPXTG-motif cell wall-anchored protein